MPFELPAPSMIFDVALDDGAKIRMRRHGFADGVRLLFSHGNGFAADAYFLYWQHLLPKFDLLVFDFRNHGQNVPVTPSNHNYEQLTRDLQRVLLEVRARLGEKPTAGVFHSMSARTAMKQAIESAGPGMRSCYSIHQMYRRPGTRTIRRWRFLRRGSQDGRASAAGASPRSTSWPRSIGNHGRPLAGSTVHMS